MIFRCGFRGSARSFEYRLIDMMCGFDGFPSAVISSDNVIFGFSVAALGITFIPVGIGEGFVVVPSPLAFLVGIAKADPE